jgi:hypothetical protein
MPWFQYDGQQLRRDACITTPPPRPARDVALPLATFPARNAPLGVAFVPPGALGLGRHRRLSFPCTKSQDF